MSAGDKCFLTIMNPRAGTRRGQNVLDCITPKIRAAGFECDVIATVRSGHARQIILDHDVQKYRGVCVIGGDGTIHEVVDGLMHRQDTGLPPLGIIPGGTGNSIAAHLECTSASEAIDRVITGTTESLDVIRVQLDDATVYCANIVGWGNAVDINRTAECLRMFGTPRYTMAALLHILIAKKRRARVVLDGETIEDIFSLVLACNTRFTGKNMELAPQAQSNDGKIDVVLVRNATRMQLIKLFRGVYNGSHLVLPCVETHQVRNFAIQSEEADLLNLDGELKGTTPFAATILPSALRVFR
jgi:YegS/Rv2252/BmrU family lipid kinase